jgi:ribosomal protein S18 acetylase RimI-like enzyme
VSAAVHGVPAVGETAAVDTIVLAFAADPVARWAWPDGHQYLLSMPDFVRAFAGGAFTHSGAFCTSDNAGAALWLPPDVHPNDAAIGGIVERTVAPALRGEIDAVFEQMAKYHPTGPHWYLPLIGVDPAHQGKGLGGKLMAHVLAHCDHDHCAAYLESTNPRNVSLYRRHGFEALGTIQVGSSPALTPMLRRPR